ncbi:SpoIIE family protein phosphatase [Streptomyces sp. NPDC048717]|uniref:SpoIIE family protein phosphatase n=1 Tax=Streptomyces sp. NPDC048717 TaxID=3154928 RepID=UPI00341D426F
MNTETTTRPRVRIGMAHRGGTEPPYADGAYVHRHGERVCAAVVDGAGHDQDVVDYARHVPPTIALTTMTMGGLVGLITAGRMAYAYDPVRPPHVSAVVATMEPGRPTSVHWVGDCPLLGWDGEKLTRYTTDQTMGEWLRRNSGKSIEIIPAEVAAAQDNWVRLGLAEATEMTCRQVQVPEDVPLLLLVSDGVTDQVDREAAEALCRRYAGDPQALADALVAAAEGTKDEKGELYRDDATVVVLSTLGPAAALPAASGAAQG